MNIRNLLGHTWQHELKTLQLLHKETEVRLAELRKHAEIMREGPIQAKEKASSLYFLHMLNYYAHMNIFLTLFSCS